MHSSRMRTACLLMYTGGACIQWGEGGICLWDLPGEGSASRGSPSGGGLCLGGSASGGLPRESASGGLHPGLSISRGVFIRGVSLGDLSNPPGLSTGRIGLGRPLCPCEQNDTLV